MAKLKVKPQPEQIAAWVEANFDYKPRKSGAEYLINNPFDGDTGYNFNISLTKGVCHDWRGDEWAGGQSKTFLRFVQVYRNCSFAEAAKEVCGTGVNLRSLYAKIEQEKREQEQERQYDIALPPGSMRLIEHTESAEGKMLVRWLRNRGIDLDSIRRYDLHFHSMSVVWPYYEYGILVYWQERDRLNKRFRFPPAEVGATKSQFLYGFDMIEPCQYIAITEAIIDSMTLGDQAVASGGAVLSPAQVRKVRVLNPECGVVLAPDNDAAGLKSLAANYKLLSPYFRVFYALPPRKEYKPGRHTKDWNDLGKIMPWSEIRSAFEDSIAPMGQAEMVRFALIEA